MRMTIASALLVLFSVFLTAASQLFLKAGVSSAAVRDAMIGSLTTTITSLATSPMVLAGFVCFGLSAVVWLFVLSKLDVSLAYPFVALGIVITMAGGHFLFGEPLSIQRLAGCATVVAGLVIVAWS